MTTYHYSPETLGLYKSDDHQSIPEDSVEISADYWQRLVDGNAKGMVIVSGADGLPVCVPPETRMSDDELAERARQRRDALLSATDWVTLRSFELGEPVPADWHNYRQALRDLPEQSGWPSVIDWPPLPSP